MFKVLIFLLLVVYCNSQLITKRAGVVAPAYGAYGLRGIVPGARYIGGYGGLVGTAGYGGLVGTAGYGGLVGPVGYGGLIGTGFAYNRLPLPAAAIAAPIAVGAVAAPAVAAVAAPVAVAAPAPRVVGPIPAAIQSYYTQEILPVQTVQEPVPPQVIEVGPNALPVVVHFQSQSSPVTVEQSHIPGAPGEVQVTRSEDEPHRVVHEVVRPVIQEVKEIIQPYRRITQEIRPVAEEINSIIAKGEGIHGVLAAPLPAPVVAAPAPIAAVEAAPVVAAAPVVEEVAAPVAVAAPITTSIIRQPFGIVNAGVVAAPVAAPIVNKLGAGIINAQRVLNGGYIKYAEY